MSSLPSQKSDAPREEAEEMILLTLARAQENSHWLTCDDLARELNFSPGPHLQPLLDRSLLCLEPNGGLALTQAGRNRAFALLRRHRLVERFFTDLVGMDWARAHEEADRLEHVLSAETEQALSAQLGDAHTCPHGNPIPGTPAHPARASLLSLADCAPPTRATISRIALETPAALRHLATLGLLPNVEIEIENKVPLDGPLMVRVGRAHYALGRDLAARIWVKRT